MPMKFASAAIDLLAMTAYFFLVPALAERMSRPGPWNAAFILASYLLMCAGIFLARRLEMNPAAPEPPKAAGKLAWTGPAQDGEAASSPRRTRLAVNPLVAWVCWPFSIFVTVMTAMAGGFLERGAPPVPAPAAIPVFLLTMLLFPLLVYVPARSRISFGTGSHLLLRSLSVLAVDVMMIVTAAFWEWQLKDAEPMQVALAGKILVFLPAYVVFLMLYAAPRLALLSFEESRWSIAGYLALLAVMVWRMI